VRYKFEEAGSVVKVHRYGGQNSWWAASNVEGVLKVQCKRGARALRYEALREMRFQIWKKTRTSAVQQSGRRPRKISPSRSPKICMPTLLMCSPKESASIPYFGLWCNPTVQNFLGCPKFKQLISVLARREHQSRKEARPASALLKLPPIHIG